MAYLLISIEGSTPTRRALDGVLIVGRAMDCGLWIDDNRLSRQHCRIEPSSDESGDHWTVIDLNSKNGTIIKGERVSVHKLEDGDEIIVGRARITFYARAEPPQRPSSPVSSGPSAKAKATPSPADTLVDSRFPAPQVNPQLDQVRASRPKSSTPRSLAFQRPPATPQVDESHLSVIQRMWRRIRQVTKR